MNKKALLVLVSAALLMCGCQPSKVRLSGRLVGGEATTVYLEQVTPLAQQIIDSATLDKAGNYRFTAREATTTPTLYNLVYNNERVPLLLMRGERVNVSAVGSLIRNYTVEGSTESALLRDFYQAYMAGAQQLNQIALQLAAPELSPADKENLVQEYTSSYYRIRREQLRFIIEHKASPAAVYALYQRLPGDTSLSNSLESDVVYYRAVAEALEERYPESPYLQPLLAEIGRLDARISLTSQISEAGFPDLAMNDIYGKKVRLSSLEGQVVLLDFWSAEAGNSNTLNAELKEMYARYHEAPVPFEVYQVALDTSKALWINAVQEQQLPWISVSDLRGAMSPSVGLYNVQQLPANFLIDREGNIVGKNLYGKNLEQQLAKLTR